MVIDGLRKLSVADQRALFCGVLVGAAGSIAIAYTLEHASSGKAGATAATLSDVNHLFVGTVLGVAIGAFIAAVLASRPRAATVGVSAGVIAYVLGPIPAFALTADDRLAGLALATLGTLPIFVPAAVGGLAGAMASRVRSRRLG